MSEGLNKVYLLGNLGADPDYRQTHNGGDVLNLRLATTEVWFDKQKQKQKRTEWHRVVVFGSRAGGLSGILTKGDRIHVEGSIRTTEYQDQSGARRWSTEIIARDILLCGGQGSSAPRRAGPPQGPPGYPAGPPGQHRPPPGSPPPQQAARAQWGQQQPPGRYQGAHGPPPGTTPMPPAQQPLPARAHHPPAQQPHPSPAGGSFGGYDEEDDVPFLSDSAASPVLRLGRVPGGHAALAARNLRATQGASA